MSSEPSTSGESSAAAPAAPTAAVATADPSSSHDFVKVGEERKGNCVPKFDALWFCYSPAYQMREYYITGNVDDCSQKWTEFWDCLKRKTSKYKDEVLAADAEKRHPLWDIRTHSEAQQFWQREFGHLSGEGATTAGPADGEQQHSGRTTLV